MPKKYDAVIIGSGVIGCCVAFELAKLGYKTLSVDKLGDAGLGSTGGSPLNSAISAVLRSYRYELA